jgi:hypothetical protein
LGLPVDEGRIGEKRGRHRLQRSATRSFLHHVGLGREIEVHLHGAGPVHHGFPERADPVHVVGHQPVAPLGHHRHLVMRPDRGGAQPDEAHADRSATSRTSRRCSFTSSQVWWIVSSGAPDSSSCPPGSRLTFAPSFSSPMMLSPSKIGLPAETVAQAFQHRPDRALALVGQRLQVSRQ